MKALREERLRVAVASKTGEIVDLHFGHADQFFIYEVDDKGKLSLLERRKVEHYCLGEETYTHPFEAERFMGVVTAIKDCQLLLCTRIGTVPEKKLQEMGIKTVMAYDRVQNVMTSIYRANGNNDFGIKNVYSRG